MGLLDDAIREHLELKRRRGADSIEVEQQEREALGPVRRDRGAAETADADAGLVEAPAPPADDGFDAPEFDPEPAAAQSEPEPAPERPFADEEPAPVAFTDAPAPVPEQAPIAPPPAVPAAEPEEEDPWLVDDATQEHAAARPAPEGEQPEGDDEDVLEETPDFLQETPEHDRLWFEQKPPKNFDWDR